MEQLFYFDARFLKDFLSFIAKFYSLFVPIAKEDDYSYCLFKDSLEPLYNKYRFLEPAKTLIIPDKEAIDSLELSKEKPKAIFTAKNCDLNALEVQDFIFLGRPPKFGCQDEAATLLEDSVYRERRKNLLIISGDCNAYKEVCWCLGVGIKPYPESGFDINLSPIDAGFIVEIATQKGEDAINRFKNRMVLANASQIAKRNQSRQDLIFSMEQSLAMLHPCPVDKLSQTVKNSYDSNSWNEFMLTCVECGGCNFICDTCHCFLLADEKQPSANKRFKLWDACLFANFAKVAGGANPLDTRTKRLRNRYLKKFDFFPDNMGKIACCGCGRCIEVCPGKIDIRKILKQLYQELISENK
ncbi:MAG: 4Fe-4S dicluster domain-containing protein [Candidatus Omnitrophota bacterium]